MPSVSRRRLLGALLLVWAGGAAQAQVVGTVRSYVVGPGDTPARIAARHAMSREYLASLNGRRDLPAVGTRLLVDDRHLVPAGLADGITVNVPQRMLFVVDAGTVVNAWPVAVGRRDWPTPTGAFLVTTREIDPTWDVPPSIQREMARLGRRVRRKVPPGPDNPLGDRWLGLGASGIGIHGTNAPASIYGLVTHGCVRVHPDHMRLLFDHAGVGTAVTIVYEPVIASRVADAVLVEVHPDTYRLIRDPLDAVLRRLEAQDVLLSGHQRQTLASIVRRRSGRPERLVLTAADDAPPTPGS